MKWEIRKTAAGHCDIYPEGQRASDGKIARVPYKTNESLRDKHAHLVAAAPELLAALKAMIEEYDAKNEVLPAYYQAMAAIKKAEDWGKRCQ